MIGENLLGPEPTLLPTDDEVTAAAAEAGITLYLTGARHFAH